MTDFALLGTWTRLDEDGDEFIYDFRGDGTMKITCLQVGTALRYRVENGVIAVEGSEPGEKEKRLCYRICRDTLSVWTESSQTVTVMKRVVRS